MVSVAPKVLAVSRFIRVLHECKRVRNLSTTALAQTVGVSKNTMQAWLKGRSVPSQANMRKVLEILHLEDLHVSEGLLPIQTKHTILEDWPVFEKYQKKYNELVAVSDMVGAADMLELIMWQLYRLLRDMGFPSKLVFDGIDLNAHRFIQVNLGCAILPTGNYTMRLFGDGENLFINCKRRILTTDDEEDNHIFYGVFSSGILQYAIDTFNEDVRTRQKAWTKYAGEYDTHRKYANYDKSEMP
jgi:transcriptional regulator with XRE-family HTH domain